MAGENPVGTFSLPYSTGANLQDPTTYKGNIDACIAALNRLGNLFAPHPNSVPDMCVYLDPGHIFTGVGLTEIGADTTGTLNSTTIVTVVDGTGISGTMLVSGPGIPTNTTATISGTTVTLSQAATATASNVPLRFMQRTDAIVAPVSNSRIDRIVVDRITGVVSVITGTPGVTPSTPALTAGVLPIARILLTSATTSITSSLIYDERDVIGLGSVSSSSVTLASATTTDLGSAKSDNIIISGTTTITGFGSSALTDLPIYFVTFSGSLTLTNNGSSLQLPGGANIKTKANDSATALYLGSGNWQIISYQRASGLPISISGADTTIASATTTDLGSVASKCINVSGTTTITGLGSSAFTCDPIYFVRFTGALTLTYNAASLILPGAVNITTAAGDFGLFKYEGSGNWRCLFHIPGAALAPLASPTFTGTPAAPTAANGTNTTQLATTAFAYGTFSSGTSGYVKLPNGVIIQWATFAGTQSTSNQTLTFPLTFPNNFWAAATMPHRSAGGGGGDIGYINANSSSTSQIVMQYTVDRWLILVGN